MTSNSWLAVAKTTLLKSGIIGTVSVVGLSLGTPEKNRAHTVSYYPTCFAITSGVYAVNYLVMRSDRYMIQDMSQPWIFRTLHTIMAFPRQMLTNPTVAIPVAFGTGYFFFPLAITYLWMDDIMAEAAKDRARRKEEEKTKGEDQQG